MSDQALSIKHYIPAPMDADILTTIEIERGGLQIGQWGSSRETSVETSGVAISIIDGSQEYLTTWRLLNQPREPGEVRCVAPYGTVRITEAHIKAAKYYGPESVVALVRCADSQPSAVHWEIRRIAGHVFSPCSNEAGENRMSGNRIAETLIDGSDGADTR